MATAMKLGLDRPAIERIAQVFTDIYPSFPAQEFIALACSAVPALELKQRVYFLIELLAGYLPANFEQAANLLEQVPAHWDSGDPKDPLSGFAAWPIIDYVGQYGLEHPKRALSLLKTLTPLFSAEFAIRPFLQHHPELTLKTLNGWHKHQNEHVRRLISEGTRPRLPWGTQLKAFIDNPQPVLALLEQLKDDSSEYVRRSVANNLNDIAKDHPQQVIDLCTRWQQDADKHRQWLIRHATRTLVKQGHPEVYPLLGFTDKPQLERIDWCFEPKKLVIGEALTFGFKLRSLSQHGQRVVIDYRIHHRKANGKTSAKVFKLRNVSIDAGETISIDKSHRFRPVTTRKYYPGEHAIEILINGRSQAKSTFILVAKKITNS